MHFCRDFCNSFCMKFSWVALLRSAHPHQGRFSFSAAFSFWKLLNASKAKMFYGGRPMLSLSKKEKKNWTDRESPLQSLNYRNGRVNTQLFDCRRLDIFRIRCSLPLSTNWFSNDRLIFPRKCFHSLRSRSAVTLFECKIHGISLLPTNTCGIRKLDPVHPLKINAIN